MRFKVGNVIRDCSNATMLADHISKQTGMRPKLAYNVAYDLFLKIRRGQVSEVKLPNYRTEVRLVEE